MQNIAIYPGTFDPITNGHLDIIQRSSQLFQRVIVAIAKSSGKNPAFSFSERISLTQQTVQNLENVEVVGFDSLLIDFAAQHQANIIVRGLRAVSDFEYEFQLAGMNRKLAAEVETIFLTPSDQYSYLSSTLVREIALYQGDVSAFVPKCVEEALITRYKQ